MKWGIRKSPIMKGKNELSVSEDFIFFYFSHSKINFMLIYKDMQNGNKNLWKTVITLIMYKAL